MTTPTLVQVSRLTTRLHVAQASAPAADALSRATARFIAELGYDPSLVVDDVVTLDGNGTSLLLLPAAPVTSVAAVSIAGTVVTDWQVSRRQSLLHRHAGFPWGFDNVSVTFTHGWAPDDVPEDIADAVLEHAEALYRTPAGVGQSAQGPTTLNFTGSGKTQRWVDAVLRYQLGRVSPR